MMLLSFIIPIYNCEAYVADCLHGIYCLPLKDEIFEIILVDDGSTDQSDEIITDFASLHRNITYIRQENQGASSARNRGLDIAEGKWIWFVDADDRIFVDGVLQNWDILQQILNSNDTDLMCFNYVIDYSGKIEYVTDFQSEETLSGIEYLDKLKGLYLWNKIFNRKSVGNIRFLEGTKNLEDMYFDFLSIIEMKQVRCLPMYGYVYDQSNQNSTSRNYHLNNLLKLSQDTQTIHKALLQEALKRSGASKKMFFKILRTSGVGYLYSLATRYPRREMLDALRSYRSLGLYPVKRTGRWKYDMFLCVANHKLGMWLLNVILKNHQDIVK